jgi:Ca2+-binding RTX toxin-like protein
LTAALASGLVILVAVALADIDCPTGPNGLCEGGGADNLIHGTNNYDNIYAYGGDDDIHANDWGDSASGGANRDVVFGEGGSDTVEGNDGQDLVGCFSATCGIEGDGGPDHVRGGPGDDFLDGVAGSDIIDGGDNQDTILAQDGGTYDSADGGDGTGDQCFIDHGDDAVRCSVSYQPPG